MQSQPYPPEMSRAAISISAEYAVPSKSWLRKLGSKETQRSKQIESNAFEWLDDTMAFVWFASP